jgi:hypothetical protein
MINGTSLHLLEDIPDVNANETKHDQDHTAGDQDNEHERTPAGRKRGSFPSPPEGIHIKHLDRSEAEEQYAGA